MLIDEDNYAIGNRAMGCVLLLYWHLLREQGITESQTVFIDPEQFDGFAFLDVRIDDSRYDLGLDESLLREGAIIYILCDLNDAIQKYENEFMQADIVQAVLKVHRDEMFKIMPEADALVALFGKTEADLDRKAYAQLLGDIYKKYVVDRLKGMLSVKKKKKPAKSAS